MKRGLFGNTLFVLIKFTLYLFVSEYYTPYTVDYGLHSIFFSLKLLNMQHAICYTLYLFDYVT